jgi:pimeloyl-[acyl-carrier protein] methyl ester esterase
VQLIILPGLDGTGVLSEPTAARLGNLHEVEIIRYPNHLVRYDDIADWLEPYLSRGEFAIIAESFSGPLAITIASRRPSGLKALILVASFARSPRRVPTLVAALLYVLPLQSALFISLTRRLLVGKWGTRDFPVQFAKIIRFVPRRTLVRRLREVLKVDVSSALQSVPARRLLVMASGDALVPKSQVKGFRAAGWSVEVVDGPHFLNLTKPNEIADLVARFVAD